jgi:hypothetical protein
MKAGRGALVALGLWLALSASGCAETIELPTVAAPADASAPAAPDAPTVDEPPGTAPDEIDAAVDGKVATDGRLPRPNGNGARDGGDVTCLPGRRLEVRLNPATVIVSVSRAQSMYVGKLPPQNVSRMEAVHRALRDLRAEYPRAFHPGFQEFPGPRSLPVCATNGCCAGPVAPAHPDSWNAVERQLRCDQTQGGCVATSPDAPLHEALAGCRRHFADLDLRGATGPRFVLVITDGDPRCTGMADLCAFAVLEAAALRTRQVGTIVLGVSDDAKGASCLREVGDIGSDGRSGGSFHLATTEDQLRRALVSEIGRRLASPICRITLEAPPNRDQVLVWVDDHPVRRDRSRTSGWDFESQSLTRLTLFGDACERLMRSRALEPVEVAACR